MSKTPHPKPEIVGNYKVVYSIFREDLAECLMIPISEPNKESDKKDEKI